MISAITIGTRIVESRAKPGDEHREHNADGDEAPSPGRRDHEAVGD